MYRSIRAIPFLLLVVACGGPPSVILPRLPRVGGNVEELGLDHVTVTVTAAGRILTADGPMTPEQLTRWLTPHARRSRDLSFPQQPSHVHLVIRGDWTAPWAAVASVLRAATEPENRMNRVHFAVRSDASSDAEEGTFSLFQPLDGGLATEFDTEFRTAYLSVLPEHALQGVLMLVARLCDAGYRPCVIVGDGAGLRLLSDDDVMVAAEIDELPPVRIEPSRGDQLVGVATLWVPIEPVIEWNSLDVESDDSSPFPIEETLGK